MGNPWTPGPWVVAPSADAGGVEIMASGNPLMVRGRSSRAIANRAMIAAAPEMAEALEECANRLKRAAIHLGSDEEFAEGAVSKYRAILSRIRGDAP